ncbi:hypothetical protein ACQEVB_04595 [Pseudonocardia sp. CA-107938]|uniref:hypothetical protein n=1 Tax=Pseudonocardia sp. CA-107938 TaxID=3240021 RepID=UPI003D8F5514
MSIPAVVAGLCDDAAIFPPGLAPLPDAVRDHRDRRGRWYADLAGPLVLSDAALAQLDAPDADLRVSVTLPGGPAGLPAVVAACAELSVELAAVEVAVPAGMGAAEFFEHLADPPVDVYVEVPRDGRGPAIVDGLRGRYRAKFRTGGVRAELYPSVAELAASIAAVVAAGVPFKATAGLHHAVRNTDPETGFEQHGFLNLLLATDALLAGGSAADAQALLAERDPAAVAAQVRALDAAAVARTRAAFTSFGTCSITEPLAELVALGIISVVTEGEVDQ